MFKLSCPACGAELTFYSKASVYVVCAYCKTPAVRQDLNLKTYGFLSDVHMDASPLQIGTHGRYEGRAFQLIGRIRMGWENGFWNEWLALFHNEETAWLAEAQGFFAFLFEKTEPFKAPVPENLAPGETYKLEPTVDYQVDDIKRAKCLGFEGELPRVIFSNDEQISVDFSGPKGLCATIEYTKQSQRLFLGQYVDFEECQFSDLRQLDGW